MKKIFLVFCIILLQFNVIYTYSIKYKNNLKNTNFIGRGYFYYDLKSYNYDLNNDMYIIDVMEELDPGGDMKNIKCPHGSGFITHLIYSTQYSPKHTFFNAKYEGFIHGAGFLALIALMIAVTFQDILKLFA